MASGRKCLSRSYFHGWRSTRLSRNEKADEAAALNTLVGPELQREAAEKELAEEAEKESTDSEDANEHALAVPGLRLLSVDKKKGQSGRKRQGKADRTASAKARSKSKAKTSIPVGPMSTKLLSYHSTRGRI